MEYRNYGFKGKKIDDPEIIDNLKKSDYLGLLETHPDQSTDISLPGFTYFEKISGNIEFHGNHPME